MKHILIILLLTALPTLARLGETKAECEARYGKPLGTTAAGNPYYLKAGLEISIFFWKDKAVGLTFCKPKPGTDETDLPLLFGSDGDPLSDAEINTLLQANSGPFKWKQREKVEKGGDIDWDRSDSHGSARYVDQSLEIRDQPAFDEMVKAKSLDEAAKNKTFGGLGETRAQCEARYGKPVGVTPRNGNNIYLKGGHQIVIIFWEDKAIVLAFNKLKPGKDESDVPIDLEESAPLSQSEIDVLLQANQGTFKWKQQRGNDDEDVAWTLSDGKGSAEYVDRCLEIRNQPALEEWTKDRNTKREERIPRLGESKADVEKRCGKPVETHANGDLAYQKLAFKIIATFWKDKAVRLEFQSVELEKDYFTPGKWLPSGLYGDEIRAILKANSGNSEWKQSAADEDFWDRADRKAHAIYDMDDFTLTIIDEEFSAHERAVKEKEAAARFKDFGALGKTKAECEKLYGSPLITPADGPFAYHKQGIAILVTFWKGKAAKFEFVKIDGNPANIEEKKRVPFYMAERSALLASFGQGSKWVESEEENQTTSLRADHEALALYKNDEKIFTIYSYDYFIHLTEELKGKEDQGGKEAKDLDGF